jgi:diguanylate cyclase (GGDEF)-like protein
MDKFKNVNDTCGHAAGDEVLRVMADRIRRCLRSTDDLGARVGGDELLVVLHGVQDLQNAVTVAEKLRASAAEPIPIPGGTVNTTVSIGVTLARPGEKTEALVARADDAMYRAKQTGRNQVISIDSEPAPDSPPPVGSAGPADR